MSKDVVIRPQAATFGVGADPSPAPTPKLEEKQPGKDAPKQ